MEGAPINIGSFNKKRFEIFRNQIADLYNKEGLSGVADRLKQWYDAEYGKTALLSSTEEDRIVLQIQKGEIYIITEQFDSARETLKDALDMAYGLDEKGALHKRAESLLNSIGSE